MVLNRLARVLPALLMSAKRQVWRMNDHAGEADAEFQRVRGPVLEAANNTCEYCELTSDKYQEVHHKDDDHSNNDPKNLACTCPLCHQVFHIGLAGMRDGAHIVSMPELTQAELNHLCLVMWLIDKTDPKSFTDPQQALAYQRLVIRTATLRNVMENRRGNVKIRIANALKGMGHDEAFTKRLNLNSISPSLMANVLMQLPDETYAQRGDLLGGLRVMPVPGRFETQIKHWLAEQGKRLPIPSWYKILEDDQFEAIVLSGTNKVASLATSEAIR